MRTYLNDREAQHRRSDVADPHACEHCDEHVGEEDSSWFRSSFTQNKCGHHLGNIVFGKRSCNGEASQKQHDDGRPHGSEYIACCSFGAKSLVRLNITAYDVEDNGKEGYEERRDEEGYGL